MASVAVFDINETTLDLAPVRVAVDRVLGRDGAFGSWFGRLLQTSMAMTATGRFQDFGVLAAAALESVAHSDDAQLPADGWDQVAAAMEALRPHDDVIEGLDALRDQRWRLVALTNSAQRSVDAQLQAAGIHSRFEAVLSVDTVRAFKPAPAPYRLALDTAGVGPEDAVMVAAHDWDLAGADAVGMGTAFIARPGMPYASVYRPADVTAAELRELARALGPAG